MEELLKQIIARLDRLIEIEEQRDERMGKHRKEVEVNMDGMKAAAEMLLKSFPAGKVPPELSNMLSKLTGANQ